MLELIVGPMFASKSTTLLQKAKKYLLLDKNILFVGIRMDSRSGNFIKTHDGIMREVVLLNNLNEIFYLNEYPSSDIIIFDEAQFFPDLHVSVQKMLSDNKHIICAGLSGTYKQTPFDEISKLYSLASNIIHLKAICMYRNGKNGNICGYDAPFTIRLENNNNEENKESNLIKIGSSETYEPRCHKHLLNENENENENEKE